MLGLLILTTAYIAGVFIPNWLRISVWTLGVAVAVSAISGADGYLVRNVFNFL